MLPERAEEAKLKAKYPSLGQKPGGSDFLMKRLQKGVRGTISYPLTSEPEGALGMRSVEVLLNTNMKVLLWGSSREKLETCKKQGKYCKSLKWYQLSSDFPRRILRLNVGAFGYGVGGVREGCLSLEC